MNNESSVHAVDILKQGGIVIFPTDTAYGIGCRIDNEENIKRLFEIRKRPLTQATPVLVSSLQMAQDYWHMITPQMERLIANCWPGGLTIIYHAQVNKVPSLVRGGGDTVGLRMPNHEALRQVIAAVGKPILGPSANFHGEKTPYSYEELDPRLVRQVDYVMEGHCDVKKASTVIDCTQTPWKIVRAGAVTIHLSDYE